MSELRKCKECGKMFTPKGREQYCSDIHYRPCPVCGTLVVAKYLSDPARRCDKCKGKKAETSVPAVVVPAKNLLDAPAIAVANTQADIKLRNKPDTSSPKKVTIKTNDLERVPARAESKMFLAEVNGNVFRFIRKDPLCGWTPGHDYVVNASQEEGVYAVNSLQDVTEEKEINIRLKCTSQTSFYTYFRKVRG